MTEDEKKRRKLTVTRVLPERTFTGKRDGAPQHVFEFMASEADPTVSIKWEMFNPERIPNLAELIMVGKTIDAETTISQSGDYTHYKVTQLFQNGQPLIVSQRSGGRGGYAPVDSPEKIASEERRSAGAIIATLWTSKTIDETSPEVLGLRKWLQQQLPASGVKAPSPTPQPAGSIEQDWEKLNREKPGQTLPPATTKPSEKRNFANLGVFFTACQKELNISRTDVLTKLKKQSLELSELSAAWDTLSKPPASGNPGNHLPF